MDILAGRSMPVPGDLFFADTDAMMKKRSDTLEPYKAGVFRVSTDSVSDPAMSIVDMIIPALRPRTTPLVLSPHSRSPSISARVVERWTAATARG